MVTPEVMPVLQTLYTEGKFWMALISSLWLVFKGITWIKEIRTNDLVHIQAGVTDLHGEMKQQTTSIVNELSELRGDIRSFTTMLVAPQLAMGVRAKKKRAKKA